MSWSIEITRGENGYKLSYREDVDDERYWVWKEEYIQDDDVDELKSGEELLWWLVEYFSLGGSKHDPERIRIVREKKGE
jgi:hypothetical protein